MNNVNNNLHINNNMPTDNQYKNVITDTEYNKLITLVNDNIKLNSHGHLETVNTDSIYNTIHNVVNYLSAGKFANDNINVIDSNIKNQSTELANFIATNDQQIKQYSDLDQLKLHKDLASNIEQQVSQTLNQVKEQITNSSNIDIINDDALNSLVSFGILAIIMSYVSANIQNTQKGFLLKQNLINTTTDQLADIGSFFSSLISIINSTKLDIKNIVSQNNNESIILILLRLFGGDNSVACASDILSNVDSQTQISISSFLSKNHISFANNNSSIYIIEKVNSIINNCNANLGLFSSGSNAESISLFTMNNNNWVATLSEQLKQIKGYCDDMRNINFPIPLSKSSNNFQAFMYAAFTDGGNKNLQDLINQQSPSLWDFMLTVFPNQINLNGKTYNISDVINGIKAGDKFFIDSFNDYISQHPDYSINSYLNRLNMIYQNSAININDPDQLAQAIAFFCYNGNMVESPLINVFNSLNIASIDPKLWDRICHGDANAVHDLKIFIAQNTFLGPTNHLKIVDDISSCKNVLSGLGQKYNAYIDSVTQSLNMLQGIYNNFTQFTSITYR